MSLARATLCLQVVLATTLVSQGAVSDPILLWAGVAPGDEMASDLGPERDTTQAKDRDVAGKPVMRIGNVTKPSITIFRSPAPNANATAVIVCPGGGYNILAYDLEGTEVCSWLNSIGVTAVLLKYRVPKRTGQEKHAAALQDAQRAMGLLRQRAVEFRINPDHIGVLGFSAGAHLAAVLSTGRSERTYARIDAADDTPFRPNFTILVYPAYLTVMERNDELPPELVILKSTPPVFIAMAQDDPVRVENALFYSLALKRAGVPFELHVYPSGGHGYGLRSTKEYVTSWPARATEWMSSRGFLEADGAGAVIVQDFETDNVNTLPTGWSEHHFGEGSTKWRVQESRTGGKVLAQLASTNPNRHFNLAVYDNYSAADVDLSVRFKAVSGKHDQGGGLVWRYQDERNHYIVRANPLEDNVVLYKMVNGIRTDLPLVGKGRTYGLKTDKMADAWHTLRLRAVGEEFLVFLDGNELFRVRDETFRHAGKVGLWTKADAVTWFDDLTLRPVELNSER